MTQSADQQVAKWVMVVVGLAIIAGALVFALLPVSVNSVECNPRSIAAADAALGEQLPSSNSNLPYLPAVLVWLDPSLVTPTGENTRNVPADQEACRSAAQSRMVPGLVLGPVGLVTLVGALVATKGKERPAMMGGWYPNPDGSPTLRWWDGTIWTESTRPQEPGGV